MRAGGPRTQDAQLAECDRPGKKWTLQKPFQTLEMADPGVELPDGLKYFRRIDKSTIEMN
jgi:hypothetical protein